MARVVSIATDLMLASRVDAGLTAAGHHVVLAQSVAMLTTRAIGSDPEPAPH